MTGRSYLFLAQLLCSTTRVSCRHHVGVLLLLSKPQLAHQDTVLLILLINVLL